MSNELSYCGRFGTESHQDALELVVAGNEPGEDPLTNLRKETDSLGVVEVPADKLWAAQTQRSLEHFSIGQDLERASIRPPGFAEAAAAEIMKVFNATDGEGLGLLATNGKETCCCHQEGA